MSELDELRTTAEALKASIGEVVVGQERVVGEVLCALLSGGHVPLEGVPGVAKTLLARTLSASLGLRFKRVQFTPDLMPADVVGTQVFDLNEGRFHLEKGPVFTQVLLADEINRTPPKTQAALLEAMQERQVTIDGTSHALPSPFFVVATQNPLDHEGTYPLPEAQLDRFLMKVVVDYPSEREELEVYRRFLDGRLELDVLDRVERVTGPGLPAMRAALSQVHVEDKVVAWVRALVGLTRQSRRLAIGASPRAGMALLGAARAHAALDGRAFVTPDDVKRMAPPVLRHRLLTTPDAELDGHDADKVLAGLLDSLDVPR